jgi:hypothetical protein
MAAVMDNNKAMLRQQGQREADADSKRNNQIETTAAGASGNGGHVRVMAVIDDVGDGG